MNVVCGRESKTVTIQTEITGLSFSVSKSNNNACKLDLLIPKPSEHNGETFKKEINKFQSVALKIELIKKSSC